MAFTTDFIINSTYFHLIELVLVLAKSGVESIDSDSVSVITTDSFAKAMANAMVASEGTAVVRTMMFTAATYLIASCDIEINSNFEVIKSTFVAAAVVAATNDDGDGVIVVVGWDDGGVSVEEGSINFETDKLQNYFQMYYYFT